MLNDLVSSSDKQVLELPGGHVDAIAGSQATTGLWPALADWLLARS